ncbi:hypothetical protein BGX26_012727, partial [Mortierella sp. AD094]
MEYPQQPLDLRQFQPQQQPQQQQVTTQSLVDPISSASLGPLAMEPVHPFHTAPLPMSMGPLTPGNMSDTSFPPQNTMPHPVAATSRPLWLENSGLTHRASFHSLLSAGGKDERLRARQDRGSIISLASTIGDDSPSDLNSLDMDHPLGELHSQQGSTGMGYDGDEYDHHGIGTGLAMMFLDFMPPSHSSPGDTSVEGDLSSAQPSRSNSVMLDPATIMKVNSMFEMGEEPLHLQSDRYNGVSVQPHPMSKESFQASDAPQENANRIQTITPGQHPNETEGMLPSIWTGSIDLLATPVHPFSIPPYMEDRSHPLATANPALLDNANTRERESLTQQVLQAYEQEGARANFQAQIPTYTSTPMYFTNSDGQRVMNGQVSAP